MFASKLLKIMDAVKNNSHQNFSRLLEHVVVIFASFTCWELHIIWVVVLTVDLSTYVELPTLSISEWRTTLNFIVSYTFCFIRGSKRNCKRLRWSRGSVLAFGTQVRGFKPGRSRRIFQGEKFLSTPSFGGEVKPSVPCHRFTACKGSLNATWKSGISGKIHRPFLAHIVPPLATRISEETTSGESWNV